jgi:hypothetical protein
MAGIAVCPTDGLAGMKNPLGYKMIQQYCLIVPEKLAPEHQSSYNYKIQDCRQGHRMKLSI